MSISNRALPARLAATAAVAVAVAYLLLPGLAHACVECRQRVLDTVFADGFGAMLAVLLAPVALVLAVALVVGARR